MHGCVFIGMLRYQFIFGWQICVVMQLHRVLVWMPQETTTVVQDWCHNSNLRDNTPETNQEA